MGTFEAVMNPYGDTQSAANVVRDASVKYEH
jgi:hypothetical protein